MKGSPYKVLNTTKSVFPTDETLVRIRSIAKWFTELEKVTFPFVGSPCFQEDGTIIIGPIVSRFVQDNKTPFFHGPFTTARARYIAFFDNAMQQILDGRRTLPEYAVADYLTALEYKTLVLGCQEMDDVGPWYIQHGEDKGDHFLFDEEAQITGVIDWDWYALISGRIAEFRSYTTCKAEAFTAPTGLLSNTYYNDYLNAPCPYEVALMDAYQDLGRPDLADFVLKGKKFQHLYYALYNTSQGHLRLNAVRRAFLDLPDGIPQPSTSDEWIIAAKERYNEDSGLKRLLGATETTS